MPKNSSGLKPFNDYALVEIESVNEPGGIQVQLGEHDSIQKGRVLAIGESDYISTNAWVNNVSIPTENNKYYTKLIGKIIYWEKFTDNNASVEKDGKKYAFIKLTKIVGVEE